MTRLTTDIIKIISDIPYGKVLTYGRVAALAGSPRAARQVSWILKSQSSKYNLPWHRVINSNGKISIKDYNGYEEQKYLLLSEGILMDKRDCIDLKTYLWVN